MQNLIMNPSDACSDFHFKKFPYDEIRVNSHSSVVIIVAQDFITYSA